MSKTIEKAKYLFVVGKPGSGKSTFCNEFEVIANSQEHEIERHGDYPFLQLLFKKDMCISRNNRFKKDEKGEFEVIDEKVYDEVLQMIHDEILLKNDQQSNTINVIEFARPQYNTAFLNYTLKSLAQCVVVHITSPISTCCIRNDHRKFLIEKKLTNSDNPEDIFSEDPDLHYVPQVVMDRYYAKDEDEDEERFKEQTLVLALLPSRGYFQIGNNESYDKFLGKSQELILREVLPIFNAGESYMDYYWRRMEMAQKYLRKLYKHP